MDIRVRVTDDNNVLITGATVTASSSASGNPTWSGTLTDLSTGDYEACDVGQYQNVSITISATATKAGYTSGSSTTTGIPGSGSWCGN